MYEARVTIFVWFERAALQSSHESLRMSAKHTLGGTSDISDDETSPNYIQIIGPQIWETATVHWPLSLPCKLDQVRAHGSAQMSIWLPMHWDAVQHFVLDLLQVLARVLEKHDPKSW